MTEIEKQEARISITRMGLLNDDYILFKLTDKNKVINVEIPTVDFMRALTGVAGIDCEYFTKERNL